MKHGQMLEISLSIFNNIMSETLDTNIQIENVFSCDDTAFTYYVSTCTDKPYEYGVYISFNTEYDFIIAHVIAAPHMLGIDHAFFRYSVSDHEKYCLVVNCDTGEIIYKLCY